ncbi:hypothetical protein LIER_37111 [Lithospermum erythrorhizon]|uniref:Uncharacterized protein n=1 Tax=Lithospermum erythrorhizon TaxID=34254 RepID=A0AAV3PGI6_LITER
MIRDFTLIILCGTTNKKGLHANISEEQEIQGILTKEVQARLHQEFEGLRDFVHGHQREQQSWYTGIMRFLSCWGKKQGATDEDLAYLEIPSTSGPPSPP